VKVRFVLERGDDWPPVSTEGVWARPVSGEEYELENVPWFARGFACGDRVRARPDDEGVLTVVEQIAWSGRYTIRVIPTADTAAETQIQEVIDMFTPLGVECEGALSAFRIVALDIAPTGPLAEITALLRDGETRGRWGWEEGCVDERWLGA